MTGLPIDWANRWLGGFCALGAIGGQPIRGPDYVAHPALATELLLPTVPNLHQRHVPVANTTAAWSTALSGVPVVLVRNVARARALLLQAADVQPGEPLALPANATRSLVEAVKQHGARPHFLDLDAQLAPRLAQRGEARVFWAQPSAGLPASMDGACGDLWLDHADTLPNLGAIASTLAHGASPVPQAIVWGLHLSPDPREAGALLAFPTAERTLYEAVTALVGPSDQPDPSLVFAQCERLAGPHGLATRQRQALVEVERGLHEAAGLPIAPLDPTYALAHGVAVYIPDVCDASTFYAYVRGENTPVRWLPEDRPLHYAALRAGGTPGHRATAAHLARWLLVPVGPDYTAEEIGHTILGIVKAAEYTGMRWWDQPARAVEYAAMVEDWYGPNHDGYRPAFSVATHAN